MDRERLEQATLAIASATINSQGLVNDQTDATPEELRLRADTWAKKCVGLAKGLLNHVDKAADETIEAPTKPAETTPKKINFGKGKRKEGED